MKELIEALREEANWHEGMTDGEVENYMAYAFRRLADTLERRRGQATE